MKVEKTADKSKDNKVLVSGWRKALKAEKLHYNYKTAEEVIEESKQPGQRKREFKYYNYCTIILFLFSCTENLFLIISATQFNFIFICIDNN